MISTERLLLRTWRETDLAPLTAMCGDPQVMRYFATLQTPEDVKAMYNRIQLHWQEHGFGVFAVEVPGEIEFAGMIGLLFPRYEAWFTPCTEILWRLNTASQGKGYATEAAQACLHYGFSKLNCTSIFASAVPVNKPSIRVMEKIGMKHVGEYEHPLVTEGHALRRHLVYKAESASHNIP